MAKPLGWTEINCSMAALSVIRIKTHSRLSLADGAAMPAMRIFFTSSAGTGVSRNLRMLRRRKMAFM